MKVVVHSGTGGPTERITKSLVVLPVVQKGEVVVQMPDIDSFPIHIPRSGNRGRGGSSTSSSRMEGVIHSLKANPLPP